MIGTRLILNYIGMVMRYGQSEYSFLGSKVYFQSDWIQKSVLYNKIVLKIVYNEVLEAYKIVT